MLYKATCNQDAHDIRGDFELSGSDLEKVLQRPQVAAAYREMGGQDFLADLGERVGKAYTFIEKTENKFF